MFLSRRPDRDFNVLSERGQELHQPLNGKVARLPTHETGNVRLFDAEYFSRRRLGKLAGFDDPVDLECKPGFDLLTFGIGKPEVSKHVAAALSDSDSVVLPHLNLPFSCSPVPLRLAAASRPVGIAFVVRHDLKHGSPAESLEGFDSRVFFAALRSLKSLAHPRCSSLLATLPVI